MTQLPEPCPPGHLCQPPPVAGPHRHVPLAHRAQGTTYRYPALPTKALVVAATPGTETEAWQLIRRLLVAVLQWEQEGEMRAREVNENEMGVAMYGDSKARGKFDDVVRAD